MAKKVTKKKAPAKKPAPVTKKKAGANRPTFKVSAAANKAVTMRKSIWWKPEQGTSILRILPPLDGTMIVYPPTALHYKVKTENGERNIAPACLQVHGDGNCYMCHFMEVLKRTQNPMMMNIADELYPTVRYNAQAFVWDAAKKEWYGPVVAQLPKQVADDLSNLLQAAEDGGMSPFCDIERGQSVAVTRSGQGRMGTRYSAQGTGNVFNLDQVIPDWQERAWTDTIEKCAINVLTIDQQKEALYRTFPDLPWEDIEAEIG